MTTWTVLRAAGIGAYVMLFLSVAWGLVATTAAMGKRVAKPSSTLFHQFLSAVGLALLGIHIGGLLVHDYLRLSPLDVLVPMRATYRPVATAFGIVAMYALVVVMVSSWAKRRTGTKWWRRLHLLAAPTFTLSLVHGVFAGTDTVRPWMWWTYVVTGGLVLFLVIVRGLAAGFRPERAGRAPVHGPSRHASVR